MKELIRPVLTIILVVAWVIFVFVMYDRGGSMSDVPEQFTSMVWTAFVWWFASREREKAGTEKALVVSGSSIKSVTVSKNPAIIDEECDGNNK